MNGKSFEDYLESLPDDGIVYPRCRKRIMNDLAALYKKKPDIEIELIESQYDVWNSLGSFLLDLFCARNKEALL